MKDSIVEAVREDLLNRSELGIRKYNTTLDRIDVDTVGWINHLYEELLDASLYAKRAMKSIEIFNSTQELKIDLLNQVIVEQEKEINELKKDNHLQAKRRAWHV